MTCLSGCHTDDVCVRREGGGGWAKKCDYWGGTQCVWCYLHDGSSSSLLREVEVLGVEENQVFGAREQHLRKEKRGRRGRKKKENQVL